MGGIFDFVGNDDIDFDFYDDAYFSSSTTNLDIDSVVNNTVINNTYITNTADMDMFLEEIDGIFEAVAEGMWWYFF